MRNITTMRKITTIVSQAKSPRLTQKTFLSASDRPSRLFTVTLRSPTEIAQVFRGRDGKFDEPDRDLLIEWLLLQSSLNYVNHHRMLLAQIVPGTGQWVLLCEEFEKWKIACHHHPSRKLWMHGIRE